ncbi:MAG TPA: NADH pyrophosphatase, partial [Sphingomicrobium sp.]|nr:NADH pyrophosphatase [Sphingomicrobium sp.]
MPLEPFFAGPGIDRADILRGQPDKIEALKQSSDARSLGWRHGAPALDEHGRLDWQPLAGDEPLFLG